MGLSAGLTRAEFALLAGPRATSRAPDGLYLFEGRLLGLHGPLTIRQSEKVQCSILHSELGSLLKHPHLHQLTSVLANKRCKLVLRPGCDS
jgi:hypothetical protein